MYELTTWGGGECTKMKERVIEETFDLTKKEDEFPPPFQRAKSCGKNRATVGDNELTDELYRNPGDRELPNRARAREDRRIFRRRFATSSSITDGDAVGTDPSDRRGDQTTPRAAPSSEAR